MSPQHESKHMPVQGAAQNGSAEPALPPAGPRPRDPNAVQAEASDPARSVWVGASAGTGKTKVLTDRVLRLMLPRADGAPASPPHKILGITFTKAGAREMALRVSGTLGRWAVMAPDLLEEELTGLLGRPADKATCAAARRLFADVVDMPGGLKIMTIHAFCQSVLARFPLEAGIPPHFRALEENEATTLLAQARDRMLQAGDGDTPEAAALERVARAASEEQFDALIAGMLGERRQLQDLLKRHFGPDGVYTEICRQLEIPPGITPEEMLQHACRDESLDHAGLGRAAERLVAAKNKSDREAGTKLAHWLSLDTAARAREFRAYEFVYFTKKNGIPDEERSNIVSKTFAAADPDTAVVMDAEAGRLLRLRHQKNAAACALLTRDLMTLGAGMQAHYAALKTARGALDYDDLILTTLDLLEGRTTGTSAASATGWVLYKLDQGLDHILVDEAQDTNPEQWKIIRALCDDFFTGESAHPGIRTFFAVGDEKQSIYSFQRASPQEFQRMHSYFSRKIGESGPKLLDVPLNISFRSARSVLQAVDATFASAEGRRGLGDAPVSHEAYYHRRGGRVEVWPLHESPQGPEKSFWDPPVTVSMEEPGAAGLSRALASTIHRWLNEGEVLSSYGRAIRPGDILILMHTRKTPLFAGIVSALRREGIRVSGIDRMVPTHHLAVQDLLALAEFALLPTDSLALACVLKSPLIGFGEEELFELAYGRGTDESLWERLYALKHTRKTYEEIYEYLQRFVSAAREVHPYEFFSHALLGHGPKHTGCNSGMGAIRARLGEEALEPLDEFMNMAMAYEREKIPSLQEFMHWQAQDETEIKREADEHRQEVRVMTIHGAKGLQAPVVILPDTILSTGGGIRHDRQFIWPDRSGLSVPLWQPKRELEFPAFDAALAHVDQLAAEEYKRQLYVAMTRAEDRLYITGIKPKKNPKPTSWYFSVREAIENLPAAEKLAGEKLRLENSHIDGDAPRKDHCIPTGLSLPLPDWINKPAPYDPTPTRTLNPSRPLEPEPPASSPRAPGHTSRFRRGNITHKLLEFLPELPSDARQGAAKAYLEQQTDIKEPERKAILAEILTILEEPGYAAIFGPGSLAEVPLTGTIGTNMISGQVDRLLVTDNEILIIDYKTNRPPPETPEAIPALYRAQMQAYADILRRIYPGRALRAALLWTDGPRLMEVPLAGE